MARHLILGGTGFVGRNVAPRLLKAGEQVTITSRSSAPLLDVVDRMFKPEHLQLELTTADWTTVLDGFDVVHHYAWSSIPQTAADDPVADLDQHVRPTLAMLEAARRLGGKRVIFLSSGGTVYGALPTGLAVESDHPKPLIIYGATKLAVETYLRVYHASEDVDCVVVRLSNPYGSGQSLERNQGLVTTFVMRALTGQPLTVWGDGSVVRDYVHISDVAEALTRIALSPPRSLGKDLPIFNVASGVGASVNEVIAIIERQLGIQLDVTRSSGRRIDLPVSVLDITRTRAAIGWRPELSLEQGIALMCREAGRDHRSSP